MYTVEQARKDIATLFLTNWNNRTPVAMENVQTDLDKGTAPWTRLTIMPTTRKGYSIGNREIRRHMYVGTIFVQSFIPSGSGTKEADILTDAAIAALDDRRVGECCISDGSIKRAQDDGKWYMTTTSFEYWYVTTAD